MTVEVVTKRAGLSDAEIETHASADTVFVKDGHLHVAVSQRNSNDEHVAIYTPGSWVSTVVKD